jgi:hypothetical protein
MLFGPSLQEVIEVEGEWNRKLYRRRKEVRVVTKTI